MFLEILFTLTSFSPFSCQTKRFGISHAVLRPFHDRGFPASFNNNYFAKKSPRLLLKTADLEEHVEHTNIANLKKILSVFQNSNSLVFLTSFRPVTFQELSYPIILKNLRLVWLWLPVKNEWILKGKFYAQGKLVDQKVNLTDGHCHSRQLSCHQTWREVNGQKLYTFVNISTFWRKSRGWNNIISISLLPHIQLHTIHQGNYAYINYEISPVKTSFNIFPSPISPIKIFIISPSDSYDNDGFAKIVSFISGRLQQFARFYLYDTKWIISNRSEVNCTILMDKLYVIQLCRRKLQFCLRTIPLTRWNSLTDMTNLPKLTLSTLCEASVEKNILLFNITHDDQRVRIIPPLWKALRRCHHNTGEKPQEKQSREMLSVAKNYAKVWLSVMGNFSYTESHETLVCENGKLLHVNEQENWGDKTHINLRIVPTYTQTDSSASMYYALVTSVFNDLQLVICGYREFEGLQFMNLLDAFKTNVWVVLIIVWIILILALHKMSSFAKQLSKTHCFLVLMKLLLEQGNPFSLSIVSSRRCQWISGTILLMGIILSNAYKNTNVYNMILPRKPIPYKYLQELVNDNFTIHTRSEHVGDDISIVQSWIHSRNFTTGSIILMQSESHLLRYKFRTDGKYTGSHLSLGSEVYNLHQNIWRFRLPLTKLNLFHLLVKITSLMPVTHSLHDDVIVKINNKINFLEFLEEYTQKFLTVELNHLQTFLKRCSRSALTLPRHIGYQLAKNIQDEGHQDVYQGVETFHELNVAFDMSGIIPQFPVKRAKYAERCGLWKRWQDFFKTKYIRRSEAKSDVFMAATLDGNVIIIFVLFCTGMVVSICCFCFEEVMDNFVRKKVL